MLVKTFASAVIGIDAVPITIEVSSSRGADFTLVGLPDSSVKESRERISSALMYSGCPFPRSALVINMAPADIRKEGAAYDLPLAIGILASNEWANSHWTAVCSRFVAFCLWRYVLARKGTRA